MFNITEGFEVRAAAMENQVAEKRENFNHAQICLGTIIAATTLCAFWTMAEVIISNCI